LFAPGSQGLAFLSHTWSADEEGRDTHTRVAQLNEFLKRRGVRTWFDAERMEGNIVQKMVQARLSKLAGQWHGLYSR
jgi:hypothetical protein